MIINLVNNAIQYTPEGSRITIRSFLEGQELVVEVADDGPGIPDAMKERIFDLFYTSRGQIADSRRGMGLGLALCQSIISAHGGRLAVRDNVPVSYTHLSLKSAFCKLNPKVMMKNPVMFVVEIGFFICLTLTFVPSLFHDEGTNLSLMNGIVALILFITRCV